MKQWIIGLGGIGCRITSRYEQQHTDANTGYIYMDIDPSTFRGWNKEHVLMPPRPSDTGTGAYPEVGAAEVIVPNSPLKQGMLAQLRKSLDEDPLLHIIFVTTSFGGFGSGAVLPLASFAYSQMKYEYPAAEITIQILAFKENLYRNSLHVPFGELQTFQANTELLKDTYQRMVKQQRLPEDPVSFWIISDEAFIGKEEQLIGQPDVFIFESADEISANETRETSQTQQPAPVYPKPYKGDRPFLFVSYAHKDSERVLPIIRRLMAQGYRVWYDAGIDPGTEWDEMIAEQIEQCGIFLAMMSANYLSSSNCRDELYYAREMEKDRALIYLEQVELARGMRMRLSRTQNIHKYTYTDEEEFYRKLCDTKNLHLCKE